jgi:hypothetical protein
LDEYAKNNQSVIRAPQEQSKPAICAPQEQSIFRVIPLTHPDAIRYTEESAAHDTKGERTRKEVIVDLCRGIVSSTIRRLRKLVSQLSAM